MKPVVGYMGGKRKLAPEILPHLNLTSDRFYVEPYVGMGAVYLHARAQGWDGPAILNDANPGTAGFWRCVHREKLRDALLTAMAQYVASPRTNANYAHVASAPVPEDLPEMVARWLWLQYGAFGGKVVIPKTTHYATPGAAYDSHSARLARGDRRASRFDFAQVLDAVADLRSLLRYRATTVRNWLFPFDVPAGAVIYADPPYENTTGYGTGVSNHVAALAQFAGACRVVISEQRAVPPEGFQCLEMGSRAGSGGGTRGATDRREVLLVGGLP